MRGPRGSSSSKGGQPLSIRRLTCIDTTSNALIRRAYMPTELQSTLTHVLLYLHWAMSILVTLPARVRMIWSKSARFFPHDSGRSGPCLCPTTRAHGTAITSRIHSPLPTFLMEYYVSSSHVCCCRGDARSRREAAEAMSENDMRIGAYYSE